MLQLIERTLRRECGIEPGAPLIAGVSGGPDSLCLLHVLREVGHRPVVAHFDHGLRPGSAAEARPLAELAGSLGLRFIAGGGDVRAHAHATGISIEEAGRNLRYAFLFAQARAHGAVAVAVGHTADDQAETVLMHLIRGAGLSGLTGMAHRAVLPAYDASIALVRPLLGVWREQTVEYCRSQDLPAFQDPSNESREFLRNRLRLDLIPSLEAYNPQIRLALWRLSSSAAEDLALLQSSVTTAWASAFVSQGQGYVGFSAARLASEPAALQRRLVLRAALTLRPRLELGYDDLQRASRFVSDPLVRRLDLADSVSLFRESDTIFVALGEEHLPTETWPQLEHDSTSIGLEGSQKIPLDAGWQFTVDVSARVPGPEALPPKDEPLMAVLDFDSLQPPLELRVPQPGDRIQPLGLNGHTQKLSDIFINLGVPQRARPRWPVLASGRGIVWLPGFRIGEAFRIRPETRRAAVVAVRRSD